MTASKANAVIGIHGAPRSGTSWLGQLFNSSDRVAYRYQPFFSHAFRGRIDEHSGTREVERFTRDLLASRDAFVLQTGKASLARRELRFEKRETTHLVYKEVRFHHLLPMLLDTLKASRFIGVVRDPRAVLASWFRAPREFRSEWSPSREWRTAALKNDGLVENWYGFERWCELARLFLELERSHPGRFHVVRYEHLVAEPRDTVRSLFAFCGLPLGEQTERFIHDSTTSDDRDPYGVHRHLGRTSCTVLLPDGVDDAIRTGLEGTELSAFLDESLKSETLREPER